MRCRRKQCENVGQSNKKMNKVLDIENWSRRQHFHFFKNYDEPFFNVCLNVDVTPLIDLKRDNKDLSLFVAYHYLSMKAANEVENFRYRIKDEQVIVYEKIHCGAITLLENDTFTFAYFDYDENFAHFHKKVKETLAEIHAGDGALKPSDRDDMIHHTVLPWFAFTSFSHARYWRREDSVPKISFGKIFQENNLYKMPLSVAVHHALMDGLHVGHYLEKLESYVADARNVLVL